MQQSILPDYIDGTKTIKKEFFHQLKYLTGICKYIKDIPPMDDEKGMGVLAITGDAYKYYPEDLIHFIGQDDALITFLRTYKDYQVNNTRNYIISKSLRNGLAKTKGDVNLKYIPDNFNGYIHIPNVKDRDGHEILGFFVSIVTVKEHKRMYVSYITKNQSTYANGYLNLELNKHEDLETLVKSYQYVEQAHSLVDREVVLKNTVQESEYLPYMSILVHAILYLSHSDDIGYGFNQFSDKKNKRDTQRKIYTPKQFYLIGSRFKDIDSYVDENIMVSGHFRWQPYGPQRSLLKHIYIDPYPKNVKKKKR